LRNFAEFPDKLWAMRRIGVVIKEPLDNLAFAKCRRGIL